jgi:hypothetical protein
MVRCETVGHSGYYCPVRLTEVSRWNTRTSLPAIPDPAGAMEVTDEMVEAANLVYFKRAATGGTNIECLRAALTAILTPAGKEGGR